MSAISTGSLHTALSLLKAGRENEAIAELTTVFDFDPSLRSKLCGRLYEVMNKPSGHLDFGYAAFLNKDGQSAPVQKKIEVIEEHTKTPQLRKIEQIAKQKYPVIWFYTEKVNPLTGFMGNFYPSKFEFGGLTYLNAEAAFQAQKFDAKYRAQFCTLSGEDAWKRARDLQQYIRKDWRNVNVETMLNVEKAKYGQNPNLKALLLATGSAFLVEHCPKGRDAFWADNGDGTGQNQLGKILMLVRAEYGGYRGAIIAHEDWAKSLPEIPK